MIKKVHSYWQKNYKDQTSSSSRPTASKAHDPSPREIMLGAVNTAKKTHDDPFMNYIHQAPEISDVDMFNWWMTTGPVELRQMALDILSIPAMSAEVERVFSSAKKLLTPGRNALTATSIEICELLRNWWRGDIVLQKRDDRTYEVNSDCSDSDSSADSKLGDQL